MTADYPLGDAPSDRFRSLKEVAERLAVSVKTVRRAVESGTLVAHRIGRLVRVSERNLAIYIDCRRRVVK
jgi:excisionase family DNA binding protein